VDGVIFMEVQYRDPRVDLMRKLNYPFSLIGHGENNEGISCVDMDFNAGLNQVVDHLVGLGHSRIGFLPNYLDIEHARHNYIRESVRGFRDSTARLGVQGIVHGCAPHAKGGYEAMKDLLRQHPELTAVITGNDNVYGGAYQALQEAGCSVPEDISMVAAVNSNSLAEKYTPKITTMTIPAMEMGRLGAEFLIQQLEDPDFQPKQVMLPPEFIIRQTTAACKEKKR